MAIATIPHGKRSPAAPGGGQRPKPRDMSRVGIGRGDYHGCALLIRDGGLLTNRSASRSSGSKSSRPRRVYIKSVLFSQPYLDRARNGVAPPVMARAFSLGLLG